MPFFRYCLCTTIAQANAALRLGLYVRTPCCGGYLLVAFMRPLTICISGAAILLACGALEVYVILLLKERGGIRELCRGSTRRSRGRRPLTARRPRPGQRRRPPPPATPSTSASSTRRRRRPCSPPIKKPRRRRARATPTASACPPAARPILMGATRATWARCWAAR